MHPIVEQIDPPSFTTVRLQTFYNDPHLSNATGFFYGGLFDGNPGWSPGATDLDFKDERNI
jgi:hypothetical protein